MLTISEIRKIFLNYFHNQNHEIIPSSPLLPHNDPTLLFTNAGMVQFKDIFTGQEYRSYKKAVTAQKCLRAGGKHNDLDNVGYTARHHTFFEMLGNFSFGDYFKEEAIYYAWQLITKDFALDPKRLLVTVYDQDEEAKKLWHKIAGLSNDKIISINSDDNFWSMGDTGPCGPCSEIFFDHGEKVAGGPPGSIDADGDRFVEIWNLVFMQFVKQSNGKMYPLPKPSIDTGMGIERVAAVLQGVTNNYDTDLFQDLIKVSIELTNNPLPRHSHNVIADHLRASSFLISDGILPSNEGRGYVLRRIMRRAMRHIYKLGAKEPLMHRLVDTLINLMGSAYPELIRAQTLIKNTLLQEESKFRQTLEKGLNLLKNAKDDLKNNTLSGDVAFKLYDTYGFPIDLTQDIGRENNFKIDMQGFNEAMTTQKKLARANWSGSGEEKSADLWYNLKEKFGATEFLGYHTLQSDAQILSLIKDGKEVDTLIDQGYLLTNQTSFYGESGGQVGDKGHFVVPATMTKGLIIDTQKQLGSLHLHKVIVENGKINLGDYIQLKVDPLSRQNTAANHSATHLLQKALQQVLGNHVTQKGSLVNEEKLRFDFTHNMPLTKDEKQQVENLINQKIFDNLLAEITIMSIEQAINKGATALFGEKYGEEVRVVNFANFSLELCGGTHVKNTGAIGLFKIINESSVSAGVRRIEAITGIAVLQLLENLQSDLSQQQSNYKKQILNLQKQIEVLQNQLSLVQSSASCSIKDFGKCVFINQHFKDFSINNLKSEVDKIKNKYDNAIIVLTDTSANKVTLVVGVSKLLAEKISAVALVKAGAEILGGKGGGGRNDMAQAGGNDPCKIPQMLEHLEKIVRQAT